MRVRSPNASAGSAKICVDWRNDLRFVPRTMWNWGRNFMSRLTLLLWSLAMMTPLVCCAEESSEADRVVSALIAAIAEWREQVEFACRFTYRESFVHTREIGLTGEWGSRVGKAEEENRAEGVYCKRRDQIRLAMDYGRPPDVTASRDGSGSHRTNESFDEVSVGQLSALFAVQRGVSKDMVRVVERSSEADSAYRSGPMDNVSYPNPFNWGGGRDGSELVRLGQRSSKSVETVDSEHLAVTMVLGGESTSTTTYRLVFWMKPTIPVIVRKEIVERLGGETKFESVGIASDFVKCGAAMMARRIRYVGGPVTDIRSNESGFLTKEWWSSDLGDRPPNDEDFVITIPSGVEVKGLRDLPTRFPWRLDLSELKVSDLAPTANDEAQVATRWTGATGRWRIGATAVGALLLTVVAFLLWRRRRRD